MNYSESIARCHYLKDCRGVCWCPCWFHHRQLWSTLVSFSWHMVMIPKWNPADPNTQAQTFWLSNIQVARFRCLSANTVVGDGHSHSCHGSETSCESRSRSDPGKRSRSVIVAPSFLENLKFWNERAVKMRANRIQIDAKELKSVGKQSIFKVTECARTQELLEPLLQQAEHIPPHALHIESNCWTRVLARPVSAWLATFRGKNNNQIDNSHEAKRSTSSTSFEISLCDSVTLASFCVLIDSSTQVSQDFTNLFPQQDAMMAKARLLQDHRSKVYPCQSHPLEAFHVHNFTLHHTSA